MSPIRVVHVLGSLNRGGAESVALDLCRRMSPNEVEQTFVCLSGERGTLAPEFEAAGAAVVPLAATSPVFGPRFLKLLWKTGPDVVVSHVSLASGLILLLAAGAGVRLRVARVHSDGDGRSTALGRSAYRALMRMLLSVSAHRVLAVSRTAVEFASLGPGSTKRLRRRSSVVVNGVDLTRFVPRSMEACSQPKVVHVGRSEAVKNRTRLVKIAPLLNAQGISLDLISSDGYSDLDGQPLEAVNLVGPVNDVAAVLPTYSALVLTSVREGLPGVVLEAVACGVPVVASRLPVLEDLQSEVGGISLVSLEEDNAVWAGEISAAVRGRSSSPGCATSLEGTPYDLQVSVEYWRQLFAESRA